MSFYKKVIGTMVLTMVLLLTAVLPYPLQDGTAYAAGDPKIEIKSEIGYKGNMKQDKWNPLKLTLTSDRDISGDIVLRITNTNGYGQQAAYVKHVELPKDTPKELIMGLPGYFYNKDNNSLTFYEGSYKNGKQIKFAAGKNYLQKSPMMNGLVGVLSDDPDTMNFLSSLNAKGNPLATIPFNEEDIPTDPKLLNGLDVLVINNYASDTLSKQQQESIKTWVRSGGSLVLSGGAGYSKTAAPFADIAPVKANGTMVVQKLTELQKLGGKTLKLDGDFTISKAEPVEGASVDSQTAGVPLFASRSIEQGTVWYAAYDVAMEPVSSWAGHGAAWASVLRNDLPLSSNMYYGSPIDNLSYILDYFPSLKMPSFPMLMWMLIAYALVVAPILYFVLKKADKREWAWFLIPLIAVIASGTVYLIGSSDKTQEMAHTINIMELNGEGSAVKTTASAFFTPSSGDYELEFPKNTYLTTQRSGGAFGGGIEDNKNFIRIEEEQTKLELRDMPQWSLAKLMAENAGTEKTGQLEMNLKLDSKGQLSGEVKNETMNDLKEVVLVVGGKAYKLGHISQKDSAAVPASGNSVMRVTGGDISYLLYPHNNNNDEYNRQRGILDMYTNKMNTTRKNAYIFGWSQDNLTSYKRKGKEVQSDQLNFWVQPVSFQWNQNGAVNIPYGYLTPEITQANAPTFFENPHGIELAQGTVVAEFPLISEMDVKYSEFSIKGTKLSGGMTMEIWNAADGEWEPMPDNKGVFTVKDNPEKYIVDKKIRFSVTAKDQGMFQMPELSVKGEVNQ
ncbi:DUF7408 domain-containing protein [Paenibacillus dakarensis]|uniref:DUF7408 domain-containing protein n=1 Tax=Paenibacillus dakarensis TaxID=1527293 RepID=UPI0006D56F79|nr:hypothetical protein [Paenibacillus dakarensis]